MKSHREERIMEVMHDIIKTNGSIRRLDLRKQLRLSINQYTRLKSHFEEEYDDCEYQKETKTWRFVAV